MQTMFSKVVCVLAVAACATSMAVFRPPNCPELIAEAKVLPVCNAFAPLLVHITRHQRRLSCISVQGDWPRIPRLRAVDGSKTVLPRRGVQAQIAQANANLTAANTHLNTTEKKLDKAIAAATVRRHAEP